MIIIYMSELGQGGGVGSPDGPVGLLIIFTAL
jgi:hypothetical protein